MALKLTDLQVTNHSFRLTSACLVGLANNDGLAIIAYNDSSLCTTPPTTASVFAPGCLMFNKAGTSTTTNLFANSGTTASVTWTAITIS